jgi:tetratricopeptide (TPR) repeat protein
MSRLLLSTLFLLAAVPALLLRAAGPDASSRRKEARHHFERGHFARAAALLEEELPLVEERAGPSDLETLKVLDELATAYRALGKTKRSERVLTEMRRRRRPEVADLGLMAAAFARARRLDDAREELRQALALAPDNPHLHVQFAEYCQKAGDAETAARHLDKAAALGREDYHLLVRLSGVYRAAGLAPQASEALERAMEVCPECVDAYLELGYTTEQPAEAESLFQTALKLDPDDPQNARHMAAFYARQGRWADAQKMTLRAFDLASDKGPAEIFVVLSHLAPIYGRDADLALRALELAQKSASLDLFLAMSWPLQRAGDTRNASVLKVLHDAVLPILERSASASSRTWMHLGSMATRIGEPASAESHFLRALSLDPENADAAILLIRARRELGGDEGVEELCDRALSALRRENREGGSDEANLKELLLTAYRHESRRDERRTEDAFRKIGQFIEDRRPTSMTVLAMDELARHYRRTGRLGEAAAMDEKSAELQSRRGTARRQ